MASTTLWLILRPLVLVLKGKESGLGALALKQGPVECGTMIRLCHSVAQLGDVVTKDADIACAPWELFVFRGFRWKLIHDPELDSSRNRAKRELGQFGQNQTTILQPIFHEVQKVPR